MQSTLKYTKHTEETEHASEPDSDMADMLKLSYQELKTTMVNILRALMGKVDSMWEYIGNVSTEMETLRKNQKEMLKIKNTVTKMKNAFDGLINILNTVRERISELEEMSIETPTM